MQNAWSNEGAIEGNSEDLISFLRPLPEDPKNIPHFLRRKSDIPPPTTSHILHPEPSRPIPEGKPIPAPYAQDDIAAGSRGSGEAVRSKPLAPPKPSDRPSDRPTTLKLHPPNASNASTLSSSSKTSVTGPATTTKHLSVPPKGQTQSQSPAHVSGQGHITVNLVNLSPVSSPTRCQTPGGSSRSTVSSSLNFPSPTSSGLPKSPINNPQQSQYLPPLKFGWAEHVYNPNKNANVTSPTTASEFRDIPEQSVPIRPSRGRMVGVQDTNSPAPIGFERLMINSERDISDSSVSNNVPGVSAFARKKDSSSKPIFKRHSTDMHNLIGMMGNESRSDNFNQVPTDSRNLGNFGFCGAEAASGTEESVRNGNNVNMPGKQSSASSSNRKFLLFLFELSVFFVVICILRLCVPVFVRL